MNRHPSILKPLLILVLLFFYCSSKAQENWIWKSDVIFEDHHDPSIIDLKDNGSIKFDDSTGYDKLENWEQGQPCLFVYNSQKGLNLINLKNKDAIHISVWYNHTHPIDLICDSCCEGNGTTMGISTCFREGATLWELEMNRVCKEIEKWLTRSEQQQLQQTLLKWSEYKEAQSDFIFVLYEKSSGSIAKIEAAQNHLSLMRSQAELFTGFFDQWWH
jgi:hypothetical protein